MQFAECLLLKEPLPKKIGPIDVERQRMAEKLIELSGESLNMVFIKQCMHIQSCMHITCAVKPK